MRRQMLVLWVAVLAAVTVSGVACAADGAGQSKARASSAPQASNSPRATPASGVKTVVYYFHGTYRCPTCRKIEAYAEEAVKAAFGPELSSGQIAWMPLNIEEPPNEHFVKDYALYTRSLVVVDSSNPKRFKNLEKVWQLARDKAAFAKYVQDELRAFRES